MGLRFRRCPQLRLVYIQAVEGLPPYFTYESLVLHFVFCAATVLFVSSGTELVRTEFTKLGVVCIVLV